MTTERKGKCIRNFAEVRRKCMNASRRIRKYMSLLSHESSYRRQVVAGSVRKFWKSAFVRDSFASGMQTSQRTNERRGMNERSERASEELALVRHEVGGPRRKNFNLGIFKINEPLEPCVRQITCSLSQVFCTPVLCTRYIGIFEREYKAVARI